MKKLLSAVALAIATTCITLMAAVAHATVANSHLMQSAHLPNPQVNHPANSSDVFSDVSDLSNLVLDTIQLAQATAESCREIGKVLIGNRCGTPRLTRHLFCETDLLSGEDNEVGIDFTNPGGNNFPYGAEVDTTTRRINHRNAQEWGCDLGLLPNVFTQFNEHECSISNELQSLPNTGGHSPGGAIAFHTGGTLPSIKDCRFPTAKSCRAVGYRYIPGTTPVNFNFGGEANRATHRCEPCPAGQIPSADGLSCESSCSAGQVPNRAGTACIACPSGQIPKTSFTYAEQQDGDVCQACPAGQIPNADGTSCQACTNGQIPSADGASCIDYTTSPGFTRPFACEVLSSTELADSGGLLLMNDAVRGSYTYNASTKELTIGGRTFNCAGQRNREPYLRNRHCSVAGFIADTGYTPPDDSDSTDNPNPDLVPILDQATQKGWVRKDGTGVDCRAPSPAECARSGLYLAPGDICRPCPSGHRPNSEGTACVETTATRPFACEVLPPDRLVSGARLVNLFGNPTYDDATQQLTFGSAKFDCSGRPNLPPTPRDAKCNETDFIEDTQREFAGTTRLERMQTAKRFFDANPGVIRRGWIKSDGTGVDCRTNSQTQCIDMGGILLEANGVCTACPSGRVPNTLGTRCIANEQVCITQGQVYNELSGNCEACGGAELRHGNSCVSSCPAGTLANSDNDTCIATQASCNANNQVYNAAADACQTCPSRIPYRSGKKGNFCLFECAGHKFANRDKICVNTSVENCRADGKIFVSGSPFNRCESCPAGQALVNGACAATLASCNANRQIFENGSCVSCSANERINNNACEACPAGQTPDSTRTTCVSSISLNYDRTSGNVTPTFLGLGGVSNITYTWQNSPNRTDNYNDIPDANGRSYSVPADYDATRPFLRLVLNYQTQSGQEGGVSQPIRVAGLQTGSTVAIADGALTVGAERSVDISNLRDVLGRAVSESAVEFQWQVGNAETNAFSDIAGATGTTYILSPTDFNTANSLLRFVVRDKARPLTDVISPNLQVNAPTTLVLQVQGDYISVGDVLTASVVETQDDNGVGTEFSYQWLRIYNDNSRQHIISGDNREYQIRNADMAGNVASVVVSVVHTDPMGFVNVGTTLPRARGNNIPATGSVSILDSNGYAEGAVFAVSNNITDTNGTQEIQYQWYQAEQSRGLSPIVGATLSTYQLNSWNVAYDMLLVSVVHVDVSGNADNFASSVLINQPVVGTMPIVRADGNPAIRVEDNLRLFVNVSNLRDANNSPANALGDVVSYRWYGGASDAPLQNGNAQTYLLTDPNIGKTGIGVRVIYEDGVGFRHTLSTNLTLSEDVVDMEQVRDLAVVFNASALGLASQAVSGHLRNARNFGLSSKSAQLYINDVEIEKADNVAGALANRQTDSIYKNKTFALDSFALEHSSNSNAVGLRVNSWLKGGQSIVEGTPTVNGRSAQYEGNTFGIYGGVDRHFGENSATRALRLGLAVGYQEIDIITALSDDGLRDDKLAWDSLSLMHYLEWRNRLWRLDGLLGYGVGGIEITEQRGNQCNASMDTQVAFGKANAQYKWLSGSGWDVNVRGGLEMSSGNIDAGRCQRAGLAERIPEVQSKGSEGSFGVLFNFGNDGFGSYMSIDTRKSYGDVKDDVAIDLGGGVNLAGYRWKLGVEGTGQVDSWTTHQRHHISGTLQYTGSRWNSRWRTGLDNDEGQVELTHRWNIGYASQWGMNTINSSIYYEVHQETADIGGAEMRWTF